MALTSSPQTVNRETRPSTSSPSPMRMTSRASLRREYIPEIFNVSKPVIFSISPHISEFVLYFRRGSHRHWKVKMVMENLPKVMEFCYQSWNSPLNCTKFVCFLLPLKKLSIDVESPHFLTFSAKCREYKSYKLYYTRDGYGKEMEKYFVKCVGTLFPIYSQICPIICSVF